ncbi:MAG: hypothetical protein ACAI34_04140, partial [Verrucomicrobium sp.]
QLPVAAKCRWAKDSLVVWDAWAERSLIRPFEQRIKNTPVPQAEAVKFVREALRQYKGLPSKDPKIFTDALAAQGDALQKAGLKDPLFSWLYGWAKYDVTSDFALCKEALTAGTKPEAARIAGPYVQFESLLMLEFAVSDAHLKEDPDMDAKLFSAGMATLTEPGFYGKDDDEVLLENMRPLWGRVSKNLDRMKKLVSLPFESEWVRLMMEGKYEDAQGWSMRGTGWASEVTEEGWRGFAEHIANARELYYSAWRMHPRRPQAAGELIGVMMVGQGVDLGDARLWLDRTLEVEGDYWPALTSFMSSCRPRWGGSHQQMLALGLACAQTRRYDTDLPWFFPVVIKKILADNDDWKSVLNQPLVKPVLLELSRQRVRQAVNERVRARACSELAFLAWACEEYALSAEAFKEATQGWSSLAKRWLSYIDEREDTVRGQAVLYASGLKKAWEEALAAYSKRDLEATVQLANQVLGQTQGDGAALAGRLVEAAKFEKEFSTGEWVKLKVSPRLLNWRIHKGKWDAGSDGSLFVKGQGDSAFILYNGQVGNHFELKGRFQVKCLPRQSAGLGVVACQGWVDGKEHWITCLQQDKTGKSQAFVLNGYFTSNLPPVDVEGSAKAGTFKIVVQGDRLTYTVNDRAVYEGVQPARKLYPDQLVPMLPDGRVGFCHYHFPADSETHIYNMEIRKLD